MLAMCRLHGSKFSSAAGPRVCIPARPGSRCACALRCFESLSPGWFLPPDSIPLPIANVVDRQAPTSFSKHRGDTGPSLSVETIERPVLPLT